MSAIYFDYAATTPIDPRVVLKMKSCFGMDGIFGNAASRHCFGVQAKIMIDEAREKVAALIKAEPSEIIWTSGATESNNLALKGAAHLYQRKGKHIITVKTEHKSVLDCCQYLEKQGYLVTYLSVGSNGKLDMQAFQSALRDDTILVSVMHVNNEVGVIQDINAIAEITASRGILFHVDAAQSAGKIPIDLAKTPIDLMSFSAHKIYGPKGMGALYLRKKPRVRVEAQMHGGGHEQGMRSGTLATHQIVGMGEAFEIANREMKQDSDRILQLRSRFLEKLSSIKNTVAAVNAHCVPNILNLQFASISAESILRKHPDLAVSTTSACMSKDNEPSYVLRELGLNDEQTSSSIRFSFGRFTTEEEIDRAIILLQDALHES